MGSRHSSSGFRLNSPRAGRIIKKKNPNKQRNNILCPFVFLSDVKGLKTCRVSYRIVIPCFSQCVVFYHGLCCTCCCSVVNVHIVGLKKTKQKTKTHTHNNNKKLACYDYVLPMTTRTTIEKNAPDGSWDREGLQASSRASFKPDTYRLISDLLYDASQMTPFNPVCHIRVKLNSSYRMLKSESHVTVW